MDRDDALVSAACDGAIDEREAAALAADPALLARVAEHRVLARRLGVALAEDDAFADAVVERLRGDSRRFAARVVGRVRHRRHHRRRRAALLAACAAALLLAAAALAWPSASPAPAALLAGADAQLRRDGSWRPAAFGEPLRDGDEVRAGAAPALIALRDGTQLRLERGAIACERLAGDVRLRLAEGAVAADVRPRAPGERLAIAVPHGEVAVVGTRFTLVVAGGSAEVAVAEGRVRCSGAGPSAEIAAGGSALIGAAGVVRPAAPARPDVRLDAGLIAWWRFDEAAGDRAADAVGGCHLRLQHGAWTRGVHGAAVRLDGRAALLPVGAARPSPARFTIATWLRLARLPGEMAEAYPVLFSRDRWEPRQGVGIQRTGPGNDLSLRVMAGGDGDLRQEATMTVARPDVGAWRHIAASCDGERLRMWWQGRLVAMRALPAGFTAAYPDEWMIVGGGLEADLDDLRLYDRGLGDDEVAALAEQPRPEGAP